MVEAPVEFDDADEEYDSDPGGPGGAMIAIGLLVLAIVLLLFLFREELGFGSPTMEISIPDNLHVEAPPPSQVDESIAEPIGNEAASN